MAVWHDFAMLTKALGSVVKGRWQGSSSRHVSPLLELFVKVLAQQTARGAQGDPLAMRKAYDKVGAILFKARGSHLESVNAGGIPAFWVTPTNVQSRFTLFYLHGGGYVMGSIWSHQRLIASVAEACAAKALFVDYRRAPEHPFPAAVEDTLQAYSWLRDAVGEQHPIILVGDSAGGGLALTLCTRLRDAGLPMPRGAALLSPWVDLGAEGGSIISNAPYDYLNHNILHHWASLYLQGVQFQHPDASPLYADLRCLPPLLLQVGDAEVFRDQSLDLARRARSAGVEISVQSYPDMPHVWQVFERLTPLAGAAISKIGDFARAAAGSSR